MHWLATNQGARFSQAGFATLVRHSESGGQLAEKVGLRLDVPLQLFRKLLLRATEVVRERLLALAGPESREHIQRVLATISTQLGREARVYQTQDYAQAQGVVRAIQKTGRLNDLMVVEFIRADKHPETVAALALMTSAPLELIANLLQGGHRESIIVACKAAGLKWQTILLLLKSCRAMAEQDLEQARVDYLKLTQSTAQRVLRFWQVRLKASSDEDDRSLGAPAAASS
jgi:uncharacterized protein (DUF2336 family)